VHVGVPRSPRTEPGGAPYGATVTGSLRRGRCTDKAQICSPPWRHHRCVWCRHVNEDRIPGAMFLAPTAILVASRVGTSSSTSDNAESRSQIRIGVFGFSQARRQYSPPCPDWQAPERIIAQRSRPGVRYGEQTSTSACWGGPGRVCQSSWTHLGGPGRANPADPGDVFKNGVFLLPTR